MSQRILIASLRLAVVAAVGVASTALSADLSKFPVSTKTDVTYDKDIQPIFKQYCFQCHGSAPNPRDGLRLDSLDAALKGSKDGKVIIVGKSAESDLVVAVAQVGGSDTPLMPPKPRVRRPPPGGDTNAPAPVAPPAKVLTVDEVGLIRAWIDQGAK